MKNSYSVILAMLVSLLIVSCGDEEILYSAPTVTAPSGVINLEPGAASQTVTFNVTIDPALTASYAAEGSGVEVLNNSGPINGSTIDINFNAGNTPGAASLKLIVTDSEGQADEATAVINIGPAQAEVILTQNITSDTRWTSDKVYILAGRIAVESGATLTIEPGTIIKGQAGTGANATALIISRGAKIMAEGTENAPIIFTSVADEITPQDIAAGTIASPNLAPDVSGLWGGVIVLGNARISASNSNGDISEVQIEGIPTSDANGLYGGNDDADNSGVLKYISIRHGGSNIGAGNEINGLTLGGVGSETVIDHIEIVANQDDGIEWFGGTVNASNVVVWNVGDDGIDTDQSWRGTLDNFVVVTPTGHCFELDGPEGSLKGGHRIQYGSIITTGAGRIAEDLINIDDNSIVELNNLYFTRIADGQKINRVSAEGVSFANILLNVEPAELSNHVNGNIPAGVTTGNTPQADVSVLLWTWAAHSGGFTDL